ncbi:MAG TPA: ABC transporter ATP-binding protein [Pirellulaceae bacterium]|nr:ABC transporter ATP-binding protein [Pirellulaceae bacterium]
MTAIDEPPLIRLHDIRKSYVLDKITVHALRGVSLDIGQGEYVALLGPSGSGKSTLMNTLGCLDRPSTGSYLLAGQEVVSMTRDERAGLRNAKIGFVFQSFNLLARTSAVENVELPLMYNQRFNAKQRQEKAEALLRRVGLGDRLDHHPGQLSGGQQQRVAIARALVNDPAILMADEPTGNLDSRTSREVMQLFTELNERDKITIILVTHDQMVARNSKRAIVLRDGRVIDDTTDFDRAIEHLHPSEAELDEPEAA